MRGNRRPRLRRPATWEPERGIAVIRLDDPPDDADYLAWLAVELHNDGYPAWEVQRVQRIAERCRAARIIGGES